MHFLGSSSSFAVVVFGQCRLLGRSVALGSLDCSSWLDGSKCLFFGKLHAEEEGRSSLSGEGKIVVPIPVHWETGNFSRCSIWFGKTFDRGQYDFN